MFELDCSLSLSQFSQKLKKFHFNSKNSQSKEPTSLLCSNAIDSNIDLSNDFNKETTSENYNLNTNYENSNFSTTDMCTTFTEENEIILDKFLPKFSPDLFRQNESQCADIDSKDAGKESLNKSDNKLSIKIDKSKKYDSFTKGVKPVGEYKNKTRITPLKYYNKNDKLKYYCLLCAGHKGTLKQNWNRHVKVYHSNKILKESENAENKVINCENGVKTTKKPDENIDKMGKDKYNEDLESVLIKTLRKMTIMELLELIRRHYPFIEIKTFDKYRLMECIMLGCIRKKKERRINKQRWLCYVYTR